MTTTLFFNLLALGTLLTSVFTITSINPVISVILLIATFVQAALYLIFIGVNFVGISYIIIYVGAIAVLFLFVIMMIDINISELQDTGDQFTKNLPLAICIIVLFIFVFFNIIPLFINLPINSSLFVDINKTYLDSIDYLGTSGSLSGLVPGIQNLFYNLGQGSFSFGGVTGNLITALEVYSKNVNISYESTITSISQIASLGHSLYLEDAVLLITLSIILLLAMFATIVISRTINN